ncbi:MAG: amidohydrolase [Pseudomonadota bacterium]
MSVRILSVLVLVSLTISCASGGVRDTTHSPLASSRVLLTGGVIYTANNGQFAEAFVMDHGEILAVGTNQEIAAFATADAQRIDLKGRLVLPGLHDSHTHILEGHMPLSGTCYVRAGRAPNELVNALTRCAPYQQVLDWVLGYGWDIYSFLESDDDPLTAIDAAIPDRPAAIMEETSHAVWVNSMALDALRIDATTPNPPGGIIAKDQYGRPNGLLIDNAGDLAFEAALTRTPRVDEAHYNGLLDGLDSLARNGITSFVDARAYWTRGYHEFYERADVENQLTARALLSLWAYPQMDDSVQIAELTRLFSNSSNNGVRRSQIKVYVDGIIGNTTARTISPYLIDYGFGTTKGLNYFDEDRLAGLIIALEPIGYDFHIHAIGAGGVRDALNAIERARSANPDLEPRHRLTHVEYVHPDDIPRFRSLGVIADIQLAGAFTDPKRFAQYNRPFIGASNPALPLPARALIDAGALVTLSSDFDVSPLNPFIGIENAVTRSRDALSVREAVDGYTINAAFLMRQEDRVGSIEVGKRADFVVVDQNIFTIDPERIDDTEVVLTVLDGNEVFRSPSY